MHLATGTWSPSQAFKEVTRMLAIVSAIIVGLILFFYTPARSKLRIGISIKFFDIADIKDLEKESYVTALEKK